MDTVLDQLSRTVTAAKTLEDLARPMLEMLEVATGLESTYLTTVDLEAGVQSILFARNVREMQIPEGLSVPWADTLCKRALDEDSFYTSDVPTRWGDSEAAAALNIHTYVSTPIVTESGGLYGTLCAASAISQPLQAHSQTMLELFAKMLAQQVERELLFQRLQQANSELASHASTDALTGLPNRRQLLDELRRMLARGSRDERDVIVAFIDLDGFKAVNDAYGHDVGDEFLSNVARQLGSALREGDLLARLGGDEFVVIGAGPASGDAQAAADAAEALRTRLADCTTARIELGIGPVDFAGASVGVVVVDPLSTTAEAALRQADEAMYALKRSRRAQRLTLPEP
ncbi:GGDEF domain-containing protein [Microterricola viridarii]|uniref:Diguanylate cyclase with GAF sensor n=1 Tax=Microterricola viridarii TaxID=412690 RepID=A0A1H1Z9M5_9MICO|nr:sensor domain-containing diguanylate cyclase [Microterricola viridarii]SDT30353.1 diguanylate cyclase with GAF sensor [Microterricola viridarii]